MKNKQKSSSVAIIATVLGLGFVASAAILLVLAFKYPFVTSQFDMVLPDWIPNWGGIHQQIKKWVIETGQIAVGDRYLLEMIRTLFRSNETLIGVMVVCFSVVFPATKILLTAILFLAQQKIPDHKRLKWAGWLGFLAKWSMGDIFIVALIIVLVKAEGFNYVFSAKMGVYCYAFSAITAAFAASLVRFTLKQPEADQHRDAFEPPHENDPV